MANFLKAIFGTKNDREIKSMQPLVDRVNREEEALKSLDRLYAQQSEFYKDTALVESARILESIGKDDEAMKKYETILKQFPESPFADEARLKTGTEEEEKETGKSSG